MWACLHRSKLTKKKRIKWREVTPYPFDLPCCLDLNRTNHLYHHVPIVFPFHLVRIIIVVLLQPLHVARVNGCWQPFPFYLFFLFLFFLVSLDSEIPQSRSISKSQQSNMETTNNSILRQTLAQRGNNRINKSYSNIELVKLTHNY